MAIKVLTKSEQHALEQIEDMAKRKTATHEAIKAKRAEIDLSKYVKGSMLYAKAAKMKYGVASLKEIKIKEQRKFARAIKNVSKENPLEYIMSFQQALSEKNKALASAERRSREITSGAWVEKKDFTFKQNYMSALNELKINNIIREEVDKLSATEIAAMMPEITQYYIPNEKHRIRNKRNYHIDTTMVDDSDTNLEILNKLSMIKSDDEMRSIIKNMKSSISEEQYNQYAQTLGFYDMVVNKNGK